MIEAIKAALSATQALIHHAKPVIFEGSLFLFFLIELYRFFAGVLSG